VVKEDGGVGCVHLCTVMLWECLVGLWVEPFEIPAAVCCSNVVGMAVPMTASVVFVEFARIC
jgi:hypothetical protein